MKRIKRLFCLVLVVLFTFSGSFKVQASDYGSYLESMLEFAEEMYYGDFSDEEVFKASLRGFFQSLDPYSDFYDLEELAAFNRSINGNYAGIGAGLEKDDSAIKIIKIYENSPAEKSGLMEGDFITAVDGESVAGKETGAVASSIRGEVGTTVRITVLRGDKTLEFSIIRGTVTINPVHYRIEEDTAYIRIDSFNSGTSSKFEKAMDEVDRNGITKIILDLRSNPGGIVDEAVEIARRLMPPGIVTTLDYKSELLEDKVYSSSAKHAAYKVAVLADENTASASEILGGALEDSGSGFLVGQQTYGKGVFQNMFAVLTPEACKKYKDLYGVHYVAEFEWLNLEGVYPLEGEIFGAVKLTTGHYLTPKGRSIDGIGLKPLITVANPSYPNNVNLSLIKKLTNNDTLILNNYGEEVYNAERILKAAGYFTATADKQFGSETQEAVKKYQVEAKLPVTGGIDQKTRDWLNNTLLELRSKNDKQYSKALEALSLFRN